MSELTTKWPDVKEHTFEHVWLDASGTEIVEPPIFDERTYYRASFEAALERLRLAVEALKQLDGMVHSVSQEAVTKALDAIGPLPDLPPVQKEG